MRNLESKYLLVMSRIGRAIILPVVLLMVLTIVVSACRQDDDTNSSDSPTDADRTLGIQYLASESPRETPDASSQELSALVTGNTEFALDVFRKLADSKPGENLFLSPHSISIALAMTYAGARDATAEQMADALSFSLSDDRIHTAFNALDQELAKRNEAEAGEDGGEPFTLHVVNAIWGERDYTFNTGFLDLLATQYGAGMRLLDFQGAPDNSREKINQWVESVTRERIKELLPEGTITNDTRLVLTNAIYFLASWHLPFDVDETRDADFTLLDGTTVTVPMMTQHLNAQYGEVEGDKAIELTYVGGEVSMVLFLPAVGEFEQFQAGLDGERLSALVGALAPSEGRIYMPRFSFEAAFSLKNVLISLGMVDAFDSAAANLSGMNGTRNLFIQDVVHKAFVAVDEEGTEAAAATAVVVGATGAPDEPFNVRFDRPFIFAIRDRVTGAILFLGRVMNPTV